jgi:hypothetical protein
MNRTGRTIGAAVGAVIFMLFFADMAGRLVYPVHAAQVYSTGAR